MTSPLWCVCGGGPLGRYTVFKGLPAEMLLWWYTLWKKGKRLWKGTKDCHWGGTLKVQNRYKAKGTKLFCVCLSLPIVTCSKLKLQVAIWGQASSDHTAMSTLQRAHCNERTTTSALQRPHCNDHTATATLQQPHCNERPTTTTLQRGHATNESRNGHAQPRMNTATRPLTGHTVSTLKFPVHHDSPLPGWGWCCVLGLWAGGGLDSVRVVA